MIDREHGNYRWCGQAGQTSGHPGMSMSKSMSMLLISFFLFLNIEPVLISWTKTFVLKTKIEAIFLICLWIDFSQRFEASLISLLSVYNLLFVLSIRTRWPLKQRRRSILCVKPMYRGTPCISLFFRTLSGIITKRPDAIRNNIISKKWQMSQKHIIGHNRKIIKLPNVSWNIFEKQFFPSLYVACLHCCQGVLFRF